MHLTFSNVNKAFRFFCEDFDWNAPHQVLKRDSRNGPVMRIKGVTTITYLNPQQRVLMNLNRDANPFFHLYEALWMLNGNNDVSSLRQFTSKMDQFSDDDVTLNGAYGHRWRKYFGYDQLNCIVHELKENPDSRRCVLSMWDAGRTEELYESGKRPLDVEKYLGIGAVQGSGDLYKAMNGSKDVPCNLSVTFEVEEGKLNMTVFNRSNDLVLGMFGANLVHFSILQEYMAQRIGVEIGIYNQVSSNLHVYLSNWKPEIWNQTHDNPYTLPNTDEFKLVGLGNDVPEGHVWHIDYEIKQIVENPFNFETHYESPFLRDVALPAFIALAHHKNKYYLESLRACRDIKDYYWSTAVWRWINRRINK